MHTKNMRLFQLVARKSEDLAADNQHLDLARSLEDVTKIFSPFNIIHSFVSGSSLAVVATAAVSERNPESVMAKAQNRFPKRVF